MMTARTGKSSGMCRLIGFLNRVGPGKHTAQKIEMLGAAIPKRR